MIKRTFDIAFALMMILILSPFLSIISAIILIREGRPMIFAQERLGLGGRSFRLYKFRTMKRDTQGPSLTSKADTRVTTIGRWLRKYKLDELPQLWNILNGDMSAVGPRPELPKFVRLFAAEYQEILKVKPGLTDLASIKFRDESALFTSPEDIEEIYITKILPIKIQYNLAYVRRHSFLGDIALIIRTATAIFKKPDTKPDPDLFPIEGARR